MSWSSGVINQILLGTSEEVIILDTNGRDMLVEWTLHHFDQRLLRECLSYTFSVESLSSLYSLFSLLFSLNNLVDTLEIILISVEVLCIDSFKLLDEHNEAHLLVGSFYTEEVFISLILLVGLDGELVRILYSFDVAAVS